jgi:hypothetical protein
VLASHLQAAVTLSAALNLHRSALTFGTCGPEPSGDAPLSLSKGSVAIISFNRGNWNTWGGSSAG